MPGSKGQIWVAVIGALGVAVAAAIPLLHGNESNVDVSVEVRQEHGGPIEGARVVLIPAVGTAVTKYTDSSGALTVPLSTKIKLVRLTVDVKGYQPEIRQFDPHQASSVDISMRELESAPEHEEVAPRDPNIKTGNITNSGTMQLGADNRSIQKSDSEHGHR